MKTKRLLALTLALVLAMGVWPMVALGTDSDYFYGWNNDGTFTRLDYDSADSIWGNILNGSNTFTGVGGAGTPAFKGVLVVGNLTLGAGGMDLTSSSGNWGTNNNGTTLIINHGAKLTIGAGIEVKVGELITVGTGKVEITAANGKLTVGTEVFDKQMEIQRIATQVGADIKGDDIDSFSIAQDIIDITDDAAEITNYNQSSTSVLKSTSGKNVTFAGASSLSGKVNLGEGNLKVKDDSGATLTINTSDFNFTGGTSAIVVGTQGTLAIGAGTTLVLNKDEHTLGGKLNVFGNLTLTNTSDTVTGVAAVKNGGTLTIGEATTFSAGVTVESGGELNTEDDITGTVDIDPGGYLNINDDTTISAALTIDGTATVASGETLTLGAALTVDSDDTKPGKLYVKGTLALAGNNVTVGKMGLLDFDTVGKLALSSGASTITVDGLMRMENPTKDTNFQLTLNSQTLSITTTADKLGTLQTNNASGFGPGLSSYVNIVPFTTPMPSYADTLISNTPVMAPVSTTYPGYGVFVISSTGFFKDFDPDKSLYANGVKMEVGVDYDVVDKGGYAQFNIYESFMQTLNGPVVFKATFISGKVSSATVNVQGVSIPDDITASAPKTGDSGSMLGVAVMLMAIAMAAVAKRVKA